MNTIHTTWRRSAAVLSLALLATVIYTGAIGPTPDRRKPQASVIHAPQAEPPVQNVDPTQGARHGAMSAEEAFKKGVESVRGHIDFFDSKWQVNFRRTESNNWFMTISRFPKPGVTEVKILIKDNGDVSVLPGL